MSMNLQELLESAENSIVHHAVLKGTNNLQMKEWYVAMYNGELCTVYDLQCCEYRRNIFSWDRDAKWLIGSPVQLDLNHVFAEYTIYKEGQNETTK